MSIISNSEDLCIDCDTKPVSYKSTGRCKACSDKFRRANAPKCTLEGCTARQDNQTFGLCYHHNRIRRQNGKRCAGFGGKCEVKVDRAGYCQRHYLAFSKGLSTDWEVRKFYPQVGNCQWREGCDEPAQTMNHCKKHYDFWRRENDADRYYAVATKHRAKRRAAMRESYVEDVCVLRLRERDGNLCFYCKRELSWEWSKENMLYRSIEHVVALNKGGKHEMSNARLACRSCNSSKNNKDFWEFLLWLVERDKAGLLDYSSGRYRDEPID